MLGPMRRSQTAPLIATGVLTAGAYAFVLLITAFVACGISGCSGGGFGPSYAPAQTQIGLLACGLLLVPSCLLLLRRRPRRWRAVGAVAAVLTGAVLAMALLGLGPNGCPLGSSRTTAGPDAFSPGSPTCVRVNIR